MMGGPHAARLAACIALTALLGVASGAAGQDAPSAAPAVGPPVGPSPAGAALLEWVVPTAGYAYAGDWSASLLPLGVRLVGTGGILGTCAGGSDLVEACAASAVVFAAGSLWAMIGAARTASRARSRLGPRGGAPSVGGTAWAVTSGAAGGVTISLRFR